MDLTPDDVYLADREAWVQSTILRMKKNLFDAERELERIKELQDLRAGNRDLAEQLTVMRAENDQIRAYLAEMESDGPIYEVTKEEL